ncbi:Hypothetical predicted protein, partial [Olea europaea subsp. europaea]
GVDPSIRPEVWEFLLGCYALSSTAKYRRQLRTARRSNFLKFTGKLFLIDHAKEIEVIEGQSICYWSTSESLGSI